MRSYHAARGFTPPWRLLIVFGPQRGREGRNGGTWAHWQIAAAYAHYLRPDFYLQWNEWAMERAQQIATGAGAAPLARVAALEARVAVLEAAPRRSVPPRPSRCVSEGLAALHALGGVAHVSELRRALPHVCHSTLRVRLQRMRDRGLLRQPAHGSYALVFMLQSRPVWRGE